MSEFATTSGSGAVESKSSWLRTLIVNLPYIVLYVVAIGLVAMTDSDPTAAARYWEYFILLVAVVSLFGGWSNAGTTNASRMTYFVRQVLHWGSLLIVINLLFLHSMQDFLNAESHGFVIAYVLGLGAILSGIYMDWKMAVFGAFLIGSAVGIGFLDDNAVLLTISGIAIAGIALTILFRQRSRD
ncbi:MAG: hypothetical protein WBG92_10930 [Thiohalocapsa sp.]